MQPTIKDLLLKVEKLEHEFERLQLKFDQHAHTTEDIRFGIREATAITPPITAYRILNPLIKDGDTYRVFEVKMDDPYKTKELSTKARNEARKKVKEHNREVKKMWQNRSDSDTGDNLNSEGNVGSMVAF